VDIDSVCNKQNTTSARKLLAMRRLLAARMEYTWTVTAGSTDFDTAGMTLNSKVSATLRS
jgi:hypothetical protein